MSVTSINAGQAVVQIIGDNSKLNAALKSAHGSIEQFAAKWTAIGARLQAAGQMMFAPFQEAMRVFADFDDQMRRVATVSGATGQAFTMLTKQAKELSAVLAGKFPAGRQAAALGILAGDDLLAKRLGKLVAFEAYKPVHGGTLRTIQLLQPVGLSSEEWAGWEAVCISEVQPFIVGDGTV